MITKSTRNSAIADKPARRQSRSPNIIIIIIIIYFTQANKLTVKIKLHEQVRQGWGQLL